MPNLSLQNPPAKRFTNSAVRGVTMFPIPAFPRDPRSARCLPGAFFTRSILAS